MSKPFKKKKHPEMSRKAEAGMYTKLWPHCWNCIYIHRNIYIYNITVFFSGSPSTYHYLVQYY